MYNPPRIILRFDRLDQFPPPSLSLSLLGLRYDFSYSIVPAQVPVARMKLIIFIFSRAAGSVVSELITSAKLEFTINQPGCRIPSISVFGPSVTEFLKPMPTAPCEFGPHAKDGRGNVPLPAVVVDDVSTLRIDYSSLKYYNKTNVSCSYGSFRRPVPSDLSADDANIDDETV